jgi:CheY-like chemotaxis protein
MPEGGIIRVVCSNVAVGPRDAGSLREGRYVSVSVKDEGVGIAEEHLPSIFDPYFTTKPKGVGLGLAASYSIVQRHGGEMTVESTAGAGTEFTVYLPASLESAPPVEAAEKPLVGGSGRVLVMDDEREVRAVAGEMLASLGYESTLAADGAEAIALAKEAYAAGRPFDAVLMDLTVPGGRGGEETVRHLLALDPNLKAIVSSGYSTDPVMADFRNYGFSGVVAKPYRLRELSEVLRTVLGQAAC